MEATNHISNNVSQKTSSQSCQKDYIQKNNSCLEKKEILKGSSKQNSMECHEENHEENSYDMSNSMDIEPEIRMCDRFANNGMKSTKFIADINKRQICKSEDEMLSTDSPILDKIKSFFTEIWPFAETKDAEVPVSIPHMAINCNSKNSKRDSFQSLDCSLIRRRCDSFESVKSEDKVEDSYDQIKNLNNMRNKKKKKTDWSFRHHIPSFQEKLDNYFEDCMSKSYCDGGKEFMYYLQYKKSTLKGL